VVAALQTPTRFTFHQAAKKKSPETFVLIDAHLHFFSHRFYAMHAQLAGLRPDELSTRLGLPLPAEDPVALAATWIAELDRYSVDRAVLIASVPGDAPAVLSAAQAFPRRFFPYAMFDPTTESALETLKAILSAGIRGLCLFPALHRFDPGERRFFSLYEALRQSGGVAFVHFGLLQIPIRQRLGLPPVTDLRYSNPLLLHAALNAFPQLPFIIPHFGCGFFREVLMLGLQASNLYLDTSSSNTWIRLQADLTLKAVWEQSLAVFGPERIIFGTDSSSFPRGWRQDLYAQQREVAMGLQLSAPAQDAIFGGNLLRLLQRN
jgi:hypothetical protein